MLGNTIPDFIVKLRQRNGWTQQKLADKTGTDSRQYICGIEKGVRPAPYGFCFLLLDLCSEEETEHLLTLAKLSARNSLLLKRGQIKRRVKRKRQEK